MQSPIRIYLPDGKTLEFDHQPTGLELARSISPKLAEAALGYKIEGDPEVRDLRFPIPAESRVKIVTNKDADANEVVRHSCAHIMAQAVQKLWPDVQVTIGPVIENGFYYDFYSPRSFKEEDLPLIEAEMKQIIEANYSLIREEWPVDEAIAFFKKAGEQFKVEIIEDLKAQGHQVVSVYRQGPWLDLCRGPHIQSTKQVTAFKLLSVAGAYWRGDEKNPMLQRIYGTAFAQPKDLEAYLKQLEEAQKRDHRKLGKDLGLFIFHPWAPGSPFFTGKGSVLYNELQKYLRELYLKWGYQEVITPQMFDADLFKTSGHYQNYKENMYFLAADEREFAFKPMNCPSHCLLYKSETHSYRELPLRVADFGRLHRFERAGTMHGLTRVRSFCQDDAHIFCTLSQLSSEIESFMRLLNEVYATLGMSEYRVFLSTRPEKRMGSDQVWDQAEGALESALKTLGLSYQINPGDGAFYGPKLDIMFVDAIGRPWQLGTLQVDFNLPEAFALEYVGEDNQTHRPVMLHRAILGSLERFIGVYLEHTAGHLPVWISPTQVILLNVTDRVNDFCGKVLNHLKGLQIRAEFDQKSEKLNYKIRQAQLQKIPYMFIVGDKEAESGQVSLRLRSGENLPPLSWEKACQVVKMMIQNRTLDSSDIKTYWKQES